MPHSEGIGGYVSLNESRNVYNSTTEPKRANSVVETVKKAIGNVMMGASDTQSNALLNSNENPIKILPAKAR
jgi:hypothetical protein